MPYHIKVPLQPRYYYQFKKHNVVGLLPKAGNMAKHMYSRNLSPLFCKYKHKNSINLLKTLAGDKFATVKATQENVDKTILSWDKYGPNDATFQKDLKTELEIAKEFFKFEYGSLFEDLVADTDEIINSFDMNKSPGFPGTQQGIRSKKEYFDKDISKQMEALRHILPVIYNGVPKVEVKDMVDILERKIRLFCVSPAHYLYFQKKFTLRLSERFKLYKWSAYGINLYSSGADKLCRSLLPFWARFCYDISGWDKFIPLMSVIYDIQRDLMKANDIYFDYAQDFEWVVDNLVSMLIRLPNGEVLNKKLGNPSGSGSTTLDNIRMHIILFTTILCAAYFEKSGSYPTLTSLAEQLACIYGDDIIGGVMEEYSLFVNREWLSKKLKMFNLELKFLFINTSHFGDERDFLDDQTQKPLSFLGATFKIKKGIFIPCYDINRLAHSCCYDLKKLELPGYLSKIMTLTMMSYGSDHFDDFLHFFKTYCRLPEVVSSLDPTIKSIREIAYVLDEESVHSFYSGFESLSPISDFFQHDLLSFFDHEEEGTLQAKEASEVLIVITMERNNGSILQKLIANKVMSPQSVAALKVALDAWHDTTITDFSGIPDKHVGKVFTFDDIAEVSISKSSSPVPIASDKWSVRICAYPFGNELTLFSGNMIGSAIEVNNGGGATKVSNVLISYADDGVDFTPTGVGGVAEKTQFIGMDPKFLTSKLKVCGLGIEVINTTPALSIGGQVLAVNVPQNSRDTTWTAGLANTTGGLFSLLPVRMVATPPKNPTEMVKFNPFQGMAKNGCYINARMQFEQNTPTSYPTAPLLATDDFQEGVTPNIPVFTPVPTIKAIGGNNIGYISKGFNWFDMDTPVIMLTGLSPETTLTVRVRWICQIIPDEDNVIFLRAAKQSAIYDPNFFEIYSRVNALIPAACYFTDNPSGEWWKGMLGKIATAAAPFLAMIPHPVGKAAAIAATGLGTALLDSEAESRKKRRQKNEAGYYGKGVVKKTYGHKTGGKIPQSQPVNSKPISPKKRGQGLK